MISESTMPCYKYLARAVNDEPAQLELARAFIVNFESRGFDREETLFRYSTLTHYTIGKEDVVPIYQYHGSILPPEEYAAKVMADKDVKKRRSCQSYCKSVNKNFSSLCKLCPFSDEYCNAYIEREYELLRYVSQSSENLSKFMKIADRTVFRSYVDFASDISVDKPAVVPLLKEIYHLIATRGNVFFMSADTTSERFTQIRQAVVMSFTKDYPGFKDVLAVNPRVLNVMWKITVENIMNSVNLSDSDVEQIVANIKEGVTEKPSDKNEGSGYDIFSFFEDMMEPSNEEMQKPSKDSEAVVLEAPAEPLDTPSDDFPVHDEANAEHISEIPVDEAVSDNAPAIEAPQDNETSLESPDMEIEPVGGQDKLVEPVSEESARSVPQEPKKEETAQQSPTVTSDGLFVPADDPEENRFPFKEDESEDDDTSDSEPPVSKEDDKKADGEAVVATEEESRKKEDASKKNWGEIMESSMMTIKDDESGDGEDSEQQEATSKQTQNTDADSVSDDIESTEKKSSAGEDDDAVDAKTEVKKVDFEPQNKIEVSVTLDRSPILHTPCLTEKAIKTLFYPYADVDKKAAVSILKRRLLAIEVIFTETGVPYYLMWVPGLSRYLYVDAFHVPESLATIFKHNSIVKVIYQPYYLYSLLRLADIRPKNIYSIYSVDLMLHPVSVPTEYDRLMYVYLKECNYLAQVKSGLEWLDDMLVAMQGYDYVYDYQTRSITKSSYKDFTGILLRDEVLGTSFMRSVFLNDDGFLFDYDPDGFVVFNTEYEPTPIKTGFMVTYSIDKDDLSKEQSGKLFMDSLKELADKGKLRKFDLYLIYITGHTMKVYVDMRCYELLTTLLQNYFNRYAMSHKLEKFTLRSEHRRCDPVGKSYIPVRVKIPKKMSEVLDTLITANAKITVPESRVKGPQKAYKPIMNRIKKAITDK